jgi:hypothetical protein
MTVRMDVLKGSVASIFREDTIHGSGTLAVTNRLIHAVKKH